MSRRPRNFYPPLKNITASFNFSNMSNTGDSRFSNLTSSPMSNLAFNLSELSTGRTSPRLRRRLSLSSVDTPPSGTTKLNTDGPGSVESGCFSSESPLADSPTFESLSVKRYTAAQHPEIPWEAFSEKKRTIAFRRINSQPLPTLRLDSPTDFLDEDKDEDINPESKHSPRRVKENEDRLGFETEDNSQKCRRLFSEDACSQDSGLGFEHDRRSSVSSFDDVTSVSSSSSSSLNHLDTLPSLEDVWNSMDSPGFKAPRGKPPKRFRSLMDDKQYSEDTCSPTKYSPVKSLPRPAFSKVLFSQIPETSEPVKSGTDDGFQELFKMDDDQQNEADDHVSSLISATLLHRPSDNVSEEAGVVDMQDDSKRATFIVAADEEPPSSWPFVSGRGLHRSQSLDIRPRPSFKRCEPPDGTTPIRSKRMRGDNVSDCDASTSITDKKSTVMMSARRLQRCHSETEAMIKSAVSRMFSEPDLIGDCSKPYCLPTVKGKHQDLKSITPETLSRLIADEFSDVVEEFHIIDCRYPYEYDGGHIQNALNIYTKEDVIEKYLKTPLRVKDPNKRIILVFHCEFSSERGPGLFRFLRRRDRESNKEMYPFLHYPEIYLLDGGYKNFFEMYQHLCVPQQYKTMFDKNHSEDLRKFRAKCKSWSEDKSQVRTGVRNIKF